MNHTERSDYAPSRRTGVVATRGAFLRGRGTSAPARGRLAALLAAVAALALLAFAPAASAATKTTIGTLGGSANTGHLGGEFSLPKGSAVNRTGNGGVAAGSLYVVDGGNNRVEAFKPNGEFERAFGSNVGGTGVNVCTVAPNCVAGTTGTAAGQFGFASAQGIAIDQATGIVYVSDSGNRRVDVYSATGTFQGAFGWGAVDGTEAFQYCTTTCHAPGTTAPASGSVPGGQFGSAIGGLAVDSSGKVYVADESNRRIDVFTPTIAAGVVTAVAFTRTFAGGVVDGGAEGIGTVTHGSTTISAAATTKKAFAVGQTISGTGIEPGTKITAISTTALTLSQAAGPAATGSPTALTVAPGSGNVPVNEKQLITLGSAIVGGNYKLGFTAPSPQSVAVTQSTANILWNASPAEVQSALEALTNIGAGNVSVSSPNPGHAGVGGPYTVEFVGRYADTNVATLVGESGSPGLEPNATGLSVTTSREGAGAFEICTAASGDLCKAAAPGAEAGQFGTSSPSFIALDSSGNLYALDAANKRVEKFDTTSAPIASPTFDASAAITAAFGSGSLYGLDFDPAGNHLYVTGSNSVSNPVNQVRVAEMSASGAAVAVHGTDLTIQSAAALAVAPASLGGSFFLSSEYGGKSWVYVLNEAPVANPVTTDTATTATFTGTVVSNSSPVTYQFEYSADNGAHWTKAPASAVSVPATAGTVAVNQSVTGLSPFQAYKVRLVQTMPVSGFTATSPEVSFTTRGPVLSGTEALWNSITPTSAAIKAAVNPNGEGTSYRFEYVTAAQFEASGFAGASVVPAGVAGVGHGSSPVPVTQQLSGLSPVTTYYFRIVATNNAATAVGPELSFTTFSTQPSFTGCANEAMRTAGPATGLPDCRAYEQASPADKNGFPVFWGSNPLVEASATGNAVTFGDKSGLPSSGGLTSTSILFVASRAGGSWSTDGLLPPSPAGVQGVSFGWNEDLSASAGTVAGIEPASEGLFLHDITTASWQLAVPGKEAGASEGTAGFAGDSSRLLFESSKALATGAVAGKQNAYELNEGTVSLVGRVPANPATETSCDDEAGPACVASTTGSIVGPYRWYQASPVLTTGGPSTSYLTPGAISRDGSRIFFTQAETGRLYLREGGERTTEVSAPNTGVTDANGEKAAAFLAATPDGSEAAFLSCQKLTSNSTAVSTLAAKTCSKTTEQGQDLYAYDAEAPAGERLTDLTVDHTAGDAKGAQVVGFLGMSEDGSDVYFAANGVLATGATPGTCAVGGTTGECNVYLAHLGAGGSVSVSFVVRLNASDGGTVKDGYDWTALGVNGSVTTGSRVSASGALLFSSGHKLTGYENHGVTELYRYAPGAAAPTCVSCDPTGAPPVGEAILQPSQKGPGANTHQAMLFLTRNISADGSRVFFDTPDKLVPADVNGEVGCPEPHLLPVSCTDVYEWEAPGAPGGECHEGGPSYSPQDGGCIYLISTGTGSTASVFGDADSEGKNVFFFTESPLVPQDKDQLSDVYDASVGGGLASQHPAPEPPSCEGEACRGAGSAAVSGAGAGTAVFQGPGNPVAKPKPKPKKHHHNKKHRKQRHAKRSHRRAHGDRGGSK